MVWLPKKFGLLENPYPFYYVYCAIVAIVSFLSGRENYLATIDIVFMSIL